MATRYYYHVLTTLLITNRLFPVSTETVLGENVDEEFDFDGLPGVQHEFKVEVAAGKEECFYQFATQGSRLYVSYDVLRGGDRNINFFLLDQNQVVVESNYDKPDAMVETDIKEQGYYQLCFDNTQSRFGSRLVYFYLVTVVMEKWTQYMKDVDDIHDLAVNLSVYTLLPAMLQGLDAGQEDIFFSPPKKVIHTGNDVIITIITACQLNVGGKHEVMQSILYGVELSLTDVDQYQMHTRLNVMRDWYLLNENQRYVGYWSVALCVVVLVAGVGQVVFLRRMFRMPTVTPTSKPRA